MSFSFFDKDNNIKRLNIEIGKEWNSYKEQDSQNLMNSVFDFVDQNSDGKVDEKELDILQRLLKIADSQIKKTKNNNIIENEELEMLVSKRCDEELNTLEENKHPSLTTPKIVNIPTDKKRFKNYTYIESYGSKAYVVTVDFSSLKDLEKGNYFIESWKETSEEDSIILMPVVRQVQKSNQDGTRNWSEGINRNITKIQFDKTGCSANLFEFMKKVGMEQGFSLELLDASNPWLEDLSIIRADKKQVIPECSTDFKLLMADKEKEVIANRRKITHHVQGAANSKNSPIEAPDAIKYSHTILEEDLIEGKTYLEGGNVLNVLTKSGVPGVIIGEESLKYTMVALMAADLDGSVESIIKMESIKLDEAEEYKEKAIKQIALELGVKEENITFIPQFDFHIDMYYRPLNNGQIAVPDYEAGISILKDFVKNIDKEIETNTKNSSSKNNNLQSQKQEYLNLITKLEEIKIKTETMVNDAENELSRAGYEIVKIPCFSDIDKGEKFGENTVENNINFMNGICGTSLKTGDKFYITNTSSDEILDAHMEKYFKEIVGFDKVYFAPTKNVLNALGGIDCLTKEF